jgi:hypothetical protein
VANGGDETRPPLPDTSDPFELLGLKRGADEKELRRAYAKLIKAYRPDRAPQEFQRIHAAFERATAIRRTLTDEVDASVSMPRSDGQTPARSTVADDESLRSRVSAVMVDVSHALGRGDESRADALVGGLLDGSVPLDILLANERDQVIVLRHRDVRWSRLVRKFGRGPELFAAWAAAFADAFDSDPARALKLLDDDDLRFDAADSPFLAIEVLRRIAALAWRASFSVTDLVARTRSQLPSHFMVEAELTSVEFDVDAGDRFRGTALPAVLEPLRAMRIATNLHRGDDVQQAGAQLMARLMTNVEHTLQQIRTILVRPHDGEALVHILYDELPYDRMQLDKLPPERFEALTRAMVSAGEGIGANKFFKAAGVAAAAGLLFGVVPALVPVAAAGGYALATERSRYRKVMQAAVARAIGPVGVAASVAVRWLHLNRKLCGRLARFDVAMENDRELELFSLLTAVAADAADVE